MFQKAFFNMSTSLHQRATQQAAKHSSGTNASSNPAATSAPTVAGLNATSQGQNKQLAAPESTPKINKFSNEEPAWISAAAHLELAFLLLAASF